MNHQMLQSCTEQTRLKETLGNMFSVKTPDCPVCDKVSAVYQFLQYLSFNRVNNGLALWIVRPRSKSQIRTGCGIGGTYWD